MGKNYELNHDGYVYSFGIPQPGRWHGGIYLARISKQKILDYGAYEYFVGMEGEVALWSLLQSEAKPLPGLTTADQISAMYHPEIKRYLLLTSRDLFDAPNPWGPWTYAGSWARPSPAGWAGGYQPGIISKDVGSDYFWFTISGQSDKGAEVDYKLNLGKILMVIVL